MRVSLRRRLSLQVVEFVRQHLLLVFDQSSWTWLNQDLPAIQRAYPEVSMMNPSAVSALKDREIRLFLGALNEECVYDAVLPRA